MNLNYIKMTSSTISLQLIHPDLLDDNDFITDVCDTTLISPETISPTDVSPFLQEEKICPTEKKEKNLQNTCDFEYINNRYERNMIMNAYQAITLAEMWDFVKQPIESFTWSGDYRIGIIMDKMVELGYTGHSGGSFGIIMRMMQYIAINGLDQFKNYYLMNYDKKNK